VNPTPHKQTKRRNLVRWMENRQRRLWFSVDSGKATPRQCDRCNQLTSIIAVAKNGGVK